MSKQQAFEKISRLRETRINNTLINEKNNHHNYCGKAYGRDRGSDIQGTQEAKAIREIQTMVTLEKAKREREVKEYN